MDAFLKIILKYRTNQFLFIEPDCPTTNNGDRLIYLGTEKILKSLNLAYKKVGFINNGGMPISQRPFVLFVTALSKIMEESRKRVRHSTIVLDRIEKKSHWWTMRAYRSSSPATVILIGGGGNVNDLYGHGIRLLKVAIEQNPKNVIIIAPQTYWFDSTDFPNIFQSAKQEIHLFCREKNSYSLLSSMKLPSNVNIHLSQDHALYLSREDLIPFVKRSVDCSYDLLCLRTDQESAVSKTAVINKIKRSVHTRNKLIAGDIPTSVDFESFVEYVEGAQNVYTDRLHVAILATILGKKTVLFPNSYFKNKAVFEYSLSPHMCFVSEGIWEYKELESKKKRVEYPIKKPFHSEA